MNEQQNDAFGIAGRIALVTGGNRNIGRSIVLTLAKSGAIALILYRDDAEAAAKVSGIKTGRFSRNFSSSAI